MALRAQWTSGRLQFYDGVDSAIGGKGIDFGKTDSGALLHGAGTSTTRPTSATANTKFLSYYIECSATSGDNRGLYLRYYLSGGAGGEAARLYTSLTAAAGTAHGAHISLDFTSPGKVSGLGVAMRATLHIINDTSPTGTIAAVQAEAWCDGTSSDPSTAQHSLIRGVVDGGNATAQAKFLNFLSLAVPSGSGKMVYVGQNEPTWASKTCLIKVLVNGTAMNLIAVDPS